jgi:hypothetical protein
MNDEFITGTVPHTEGAQVLVCGGSRPVIMSAWRRPAVSVVGAIMGA